MQINLNQDKSLNTISAYTTESITIGSTVYTHSTVVAPTTIAPWPVTGIDGLSDENVFEQIISAKPNLVIIGHGQVLKPVHASVFLPLIEAGITYEYMPLIASFKTYNAVLLEGRFVIGAFIL